MTGALRDNNYDLYEEIFNYRKAKFNDLYEIERDLMEFGNFSWSDIQHLKVIERRFHIKKINEMLKAKSGQSFE